MLTSLCILAFVALALSGVATARGDDAGHPMDAGADEAGALATDAEEDPAVVDIDRQTTGVRALIADQLEPSLEPASLFAVSLADEDAVRVDAQRLRLLLGAVDRASRRTEKDAIRSRFRVVDAGIGDAGVDPILWRARIELDRARLAFYELPFARRSELLAAHASRQRDTETAPSAQQLRAREADDQRQAALRAAQTARAEAEQQVAAELARLLDVERAQATLDTDFTAQEKEIVEQRDVTIGWQQRAIEARAVAGVADRTYDNLRRALPAARDALSKALDELGNGPSDVPSAGPNTLADLRVDVDTRAADMERDRVEKEARRLRTKEESLRRERAAQLFDEIDTLNHERLRLLFSLSPEKRGAVTGFTLAGWDQAVSEARQLTLILRYHRYIIGQWLVALRHPSRVLGGVVAGGAVQAFEWLLALGVFIGWRRRSTALLRVLHLRATEEDRRARLPAPSPATRALSFLTQVHRPAEWLTLLFVLRWLLPDATQQILEVRVLSVLTMWIIGAALVVDAVNALAGTERGESPRKGEPDSAALRLRSLRLVGRVVVIFGLILVLSSMLVGRGTIYHWVLSTCWLASIPVLLILVRWWRNIVFHRIERVRRPTRIQRWVLANSQGWWTSFVAACVGGLYLFGSGAARRGRNWIGRFVITRRALAYLFRRQLDRREQTGIVGPISAAAFDALGPEKASSKWIANDSDEAIGQLAKRIRERRGGVIAVVGERGMGKSAALRRLHGDGDDTLLLASPSSDATALLLHFAQSVGLTSKASLEQAGAALGASPNLHALLLDDAHHFVQPVVGGLASFDALLATASRHTRTTTWVFALDEVIWQFFERSRGARPLFDEVIRLKPWGEEPIVNLLQTRTEEAGLAPTFENLVERLPATADAVDRQEALARCAADYYRLLWDAATGNPGIALHMWRRSLGTDGQAKTAVRPSTALDTSDLERLPDSSVFVLRAVLQLAPARAEDIASGSLLRFSEVTDALRYAVSRGYIEEREGGYQVTWTWFRAITLFLQRKHLLAPR